MSNGLSARFIPPGAPRAGVNRRVRRLTPGAGLWLPILFLPVGIGVILWYGTAVAGLAIGFTNWNALSDPTWIGLQNFAAIMEDARFWKAVSNTGILVAVTIPGKLMLGLFTAVLLSRIDRMSSFFRLAMFFPVTCAAIAVAFVWQYLFDAKGALNALIGLFGGEPVVWMHPSRAIYSVCLVLIWSGFGYAALLFLAGLHSIPHDYYDAARVDGATSRQTFVRITFPLLTPTTFFVVITGLIGSFQTFGEVFILRGALDSTMTIMAYIYERAFTTYLLGYASAVSALLVVALVGLTFLQFRLQHRWVNYDR